MTGTLAGLIVCLLIYAKRPRVEVKVETPDARRRRAAKLPHERGGIGKAANIVVSPESSV